MEVVWRNSKKITLTFLFQRWENDEKRGESDLITFFVFS
jgi:hypothetical protein